MTDVPVTLPCGFEAGDAWHRQVILRPINGEDEDYLHTISSLFPVERLTALLARCLMRLGPWPVVTLDHVRNLTAGDRDALALHLHRLTMGDRLECIYACPTCGEQLDMELTVSQLLLPPYNRESTFHEASIEADGRPQTFRLRLPTGRDLESAAYLARINPERASAHLLYACVTQANGEPLAARSPAVESQLVEQLAQLDPQADLVLDLSCPNCGASAQLPFDPAGFLFQELARRSSALFREVHTLAFYYHWSEQEILNLSARKRRLYLELLADSLARARASA